jgi:C-5 cytosine-specific DNA methylase
VELDARHEGVAWHPDRVRREVAVTGLQFHHLVTAPWDEPTPKYGGPKTKLQKMLREGFSETDLRLFDHVTRAVRKDDLIAFKLLTDKTKYYELPDDLRRYDAAAFTDKYNRLSWDQPCRGITAHMGKDGYWYIHPEQHRSLSIREAARVQSFPDWFRFADYRTSALRQIGEAVAPFVAEALGGKIIEHLGSPAKKIGQGRRAPRRDKHLLVRRLLEAWYKRDAKVNSLHPWRLENGLWINLMGETLFADRVQREKASLFWGNYARDWPDPKSFLKDKHRESHLRTIGLSDKLPTLEALARYLSCKRAPISKELVALGLNDGTQDGTCARFSCKQHGSFCCGRQAGRSTASGSGSLALLGAYILTFWPRLSPTSWRGLPGPCWHKSAAMKRASRRQQPEVNTLKLN